jgi:Holliday junction resolvasome RuvABC DNA-binding subunit
MIAAAAAVEPTPRHVLELLRDEHVEEVAYQAEAKAFLAKFLATCGCGPETGALACLEALGVESLLDLRDPELGAEEELAQLPAIGPKKAAQIVELAIGTLSRDFA